MTGPEQQPTSFRVLYATGYTPLPDSGMLRGGTMKTDVLLVDALTAAGVFVHVLSSLGHPRSPRQSRERHHVEYEHTGSEESMVNRILELAGKFDVVHISSRVIFNNRSLSERLRAVPRPILYTLTGPLVLGESVPFSFDVCVRIACLSSGLRNLAVERGLDSSKLVVVGSAVDPAGDRPRTMEAHMNARKVLGISDDTVMFVAAGRVSSEKRFDRMLAVWRRSPKDSNRRLFVLGKPDFTDTLMHKLFASLREASSFGVSAPGWVDVDPYLTAADFAVSCSDAEGLSNVALEAAARGVPNIAPRQTPGYTDIIDHASGILFDRDDEGAFAAALDRACDLRRTSPSKYWKMSAAATHAVRDFSPVQLARRYVGLYKEIVKP